MCYILHLHTFMHLSDAFIQSDLQCIQAIHCFISILYYQCYLNNYTFNVAVFVFNEL